MPKMEVGIVGLGKFGFALAETLMELGHTVMGIDCDDSKIRNAQDVLSHVYKADAVDKKALTQLGFADLDYAVVSTGSSFERSVLVCLNLQEIGVKRIWAKAASAEHEKVLDRLGVDLVVFPEPYVARQLAHRIALPGVLDYLNLGKGVAIQEFEVDQWAGNTLVDLDLRNRHSLQVVAVRRKGMQEFDFVPKPRREMEKGDILLLVGRSEDMLKLKQG